MNKALIVTSVASMVDQFLLPSMYLLQNIGYDVHVACNFESGSTCTDEKVEALKKILFSKKITFYQIDFARDVTNISQNIKAYKQLEQIISTENYELIHCHSPIGGFVGRLAARGQRKHGTKVLYTAHGFHFYKGAPLKNWLLYYPVEKFCARFTDVLITINNEDYALAKKKMKAKRVEYVPGVGIDLSRFENIQVDRDAKRREIGVPEDAFLLISVGELSERKNHKVILQALSKIKLKNIHYVIVGRGALLSELQDFALSQGVYDNVHFLGFRNDVAELYKVSDLFCVPSIHEGLPVALMESMASGLPCVVSRIRGNTDLISENSGLLINTNDVDGFAQAIFNLANNSELCVRMGIENKKKSRQYSVDKILVGMRSIYK